MHKALVNAGWDPEKGPIVQQKRSYSSLLANLVNLLENSQSVTVPGSIENFPLSYKMFKEISSSSESLP